MTAMGWLITLAVVVLELLWYVLFRVRIISPYTAIGLLFVTCGVATFYLPYLTPVRLAQK